MINKNKLRLGFSTLAVVSFMTMGVNSARADCSSSCIEFSDCTISMNCGIGVKCVETSTYYSCGGIKTYCVDECKDTET